MKKKPDQDDWSSVTWRGAETASLREGMKMTFAQKLQWLEDMQGIARPAKQAGKVRESGIDHSRSSDKP